MAKTSLEPFDRTRAFIANGAMTYRGKTFAYGEEFPTQDCPTRSLRLLYDGRCITYDPQAASDAPQGLTKYERACLQQDGHASLLDRCKGMRLRVSSEMTVNELVEKIAQARLRAADR